MANGHGGRRQNAGRRLASMPLNVTQDVIFHRHAIHGIMPLEVLVRYMRYYDDKAAKLIEKQESNETPEELKPKDADIKFYVEAAVQYAVHAAPYLHHKLAPADYKMKLDPSRLTENELATVVPLLRRCVVEDPSGIAGAIAPKEVSEVG